MKNNFEKLTLFPNNEYTGLAKYASQPTCQNTDIKDDFIQKKIKTTKTRKKDSSQ